MKTVEEIRVSSFLTQKTKLIRFLRSLLATLYLMKIGHFKVIVYSVAKPFICSEAQGDLVVIETSI